MVGDHSENGVPISFGYRPNNLVQTPAALQEIIRQTGGVSEYGLNQATQAWAAFNLLNAGQSRLGAVGPQKPSAELAIALGLNYLAMY